MHRPVRACDPPHTRPKASHSRRFQSTGRARCSRELTGKSYRGLRATHRELCIFLFSIPPPSTSLPFTRPPPPDFLTFNQFHLFGRHGTFLLPVGMTNVEVLNIFFFSLVCLLFYFLLVPPQSRGRLARTIFTFPIL